MAQPGKRVVPGKNSAPAPANDNNAPQRPKPKLIVDNTNTPVQRNALDSTDLPGPQKQPTSVQTTSQSGEKPSLVREGSVRIERKGSNGTSWQDAEVGKDNRDEFIRQKSDISDNYKEQQEARLTGEQLLKKRTEKSKEKWDDYLPRDFDEEERIRRINARKKQKLLGQVARKRERNRLAKIKAGGKDELAKKKVAQFAFRMVLGATYYIAPVMLGLYLLFWVAFLTAASNMSDALSLMGNGFIEASPSDFFLGLVTGALAIVTGIADGVTELVTGFRLSVSMVSALYSALAIIGVACTLVIFIIYKSVPIGIHPLSGERSLGKWALFITIILLHVMPFLNFAPWYVFWAWYVQRHPA